MTDRNETLMNFGLRLDKISAQVSELYECPIDGFTLNEVVILAKIAENLGKACDRAYKLASKVGEGRFLMEHSNEYVR